MNTKKTRAISFCLTLLFFPLINLCAQQPEEEISSKQLLKDFKQLEKLIEAHPDPYQHISEEEFNKKLEAVKTSLDQPHTTTAFYKKAASIVALLKDGHSRMGLPENWLSDQRKLNGAFPFEVHLSNEDELYVVKKFNEDSIPLGSRILSINGIKVDSFLRQIDPWISYEKKNFRNTIIDEDFEIYLYLVFGKSDGISMAYAAPFAPEIALTIIRNMPYKEWKKFQKDNKEVRDIKMGKGEPYTYEKVQKGIGLLTIYAFYAYDLDAYNIFLSKTFKEIKKDSIHALVIDLRGNFGGWPKIASRLFHYISNGHFKTMAQSSMKISYAQRENLLAQIPELSYTSNYIIFTDRHQIDIKAVLQDPIGSYVHEDALYNEVPAYEIHEFTGDCYLLTNRDSYSAASSFASTFQCYQMGTIIGEETGGTKIFRANAIYDSLNKSQLRVAMSTTKLYTACYNEEMEGVQPNVPFIPSITDIASGLDAQLFYTIGLIKRKEKEKRKAELEKSTEKKL
jgi:C-terminal processing protease CtpA/Prc